MEPFKESVKLVDANTWLIGPLILNCSKGHSDTSTWYDEDDDLSYTVTSAEDPPPSAVPLTDDSKIKLVRHFERSAAVWSIGNSAFCKVKQPIIGTTLEAATLEFLHRQRPSFDLPKVLYQAESNGRSYLFLGRIKGRTLEDAWPTLDEDWKQRYINAIASICESLSTYESDILCGADRKNAFEPFLIKPGAENDYSPHNLRKGCEMMGMDCSKFVFFHADLAPGNIIVEETPETGTVGIIDWEVAGFFPRGWIRTKFRVNDGLDFPDEATDTPEEWRSGIQKVLEKRGFEDYATQFVSWFYQKRDTDASD